MEKKEYIFVGKKRNSKLINTFRTEGEDESDI